MVEPRGARTVLVADDDAGHLRLMEVVLSAHHFDVVPVENGHEAVMYLQGNAPDLMILDIHMPYISGLDVCARARRLAHLKHIPIIIMTSHQDEEANRKADEAGADLLLAKPFTGQNLRGAVQDLLARPVLGRPA
jgi:CheY-like chemotaxis protein